MLQSHDAWALFTITCRQNCLQSHIKINKLEHRTDNLIRICDSRVKYQLLNSSTRGPGFIGSVSVQRTHAVTAVPSSRHYTGTISVQFLGKRDWRDFIQGKDLAQNREMISDFARLQDFLRD